MILIYTKTKVNRLEYTVNFIFEDLLGVKYALTDNLNEISNHEGPLINYSEEKISNAIQIIPDTLIFSSKIEKISPEIGIWNDIITLFPQKKDQIIPFDIFAATFYMISRYEEYVIKERDKHGRFMAESSIAYKNNFLRKPIVDIWVLKLKELIVEKYQNFYFPVKEFKFLPTIDVDNAWSYKHKGFIRTAGGIARSAINLKFGEILNRVMVLYFGKKDPYDNYEFMETIHEKYSLSPYYFFLMKNYGKYDTGHSVKNKYFRKLIKSISRKYVVGIHPSYNSNSKVALIKEETGALADIIGKMLKRSRNHFLRIKLPYTFNALSKIGINEDYSLGYGSQPGFRAGTCTPFYFYNLKKDQSTDVKVFPFQLMDATLNYYLKAKPEEAKKIIKQIINEVVQVKGLLISIWHNESFNGKIWKNWKAVYEYLLSESCNHTNLTSNVTINESYPSRA